MKTKSTETILYSTVGVLAMGLVLVALNFVTGLFNQRVDLTEEKVYTLSEGTRAILDDLDTKVTIRFYCTRGGSATPENVFLKKYARGVEDLLDEYKQAGGGRIVIEKYDPEPDSDAEDNARLNGVEGQMLSNGERFYLGLSVSVLDETQTMPFLSPVRESLLEYDLSRAIALVADPEKPVVGVLSALPVFGMQANPMMRQMGQQGQPPWALITDLERDYDVRRLDMDLKEIDEEVKVLIVIHPKDVSDKALFAIDQFVMRGGKLIAFVDPVCVSDTTGQNPMMRGAGGGSSTLGKLFDAWGVGFDTGKTVADVNFMFGGMGNPQNVAPAFLQLTAQGINGEDVATSQLSDIWLPFAGALTGTPAEGLEKTILFHSSEDSQLVDGFMATLSGPNILKEFKASETEYALALRLSGKFKSAFPDGQPVEQEETDATEEQGDAEEEAEPEEEGPPTLKETEGENSVILVGDADLLSDQFSLQRLRSPFGVLVQLLNGNLPFAQNVVEQMSGNNNLIAVRSRGTLSRPFTLVKKMEGEARARYQDRIRELEDGLADAERRLNELQQEKDEGQRFILSPEQEAEIAKFRQKQVEVSRELKTERKNLRREIDRLENRVTWVNIAAVPLLVAVGGVGLAFWKRKHTAAR